MTVKALKSRKNMFIALIVVILILFFMLFLYLKPRSSEVGKPVQSVENKSNIQLETNSNTALREPSSSQTVVQSPHSTATASPEAVLYDTKSDMTIQPVDPETDPANKVDKN